MERTAPTQQKTVCFLWHCWHANESIPSVLCVSLGEIRVKLGFGCHPKQIRNHYVTLYTCERVWDFNLLMRNADVAAMRAMSTIYCVHIHYPLPRHIRRMHMSSGWLHLLSVLLRSLLFHQENKLNGAVLTKSSSDEGWQLFMRANDADTKTRRRQTKKLRAHFKCINALNDNLPPWCE